MLERFRSEKNFSPSDPITYAGRLDPMAEGIVPVLTGPARFEKDTLIGLDKTYELTVLLGVSTDSADMLGRVTAVSSAVIQENSIKESVSKLSEVTELPYPMYSSRPVQGKPLFMHARAGTIVSVPHKKVTIKNISLLGSEHLTLEKCVEETLPIIEKVVGDFRQNEIIALWEQQPLDTQVVLVTFSATVSSGTYMRSLAEVLGKKLGVPALAYRIRRTRVGEYGI